MTDAEIDRALGGATSRLCEWCWKNQWPAGSASGYEAVGLRVCEACYYQTPPVTDVDMHVHLCDTLKRWRGLAREAIPTLVAEVRFLKVLLADRRLESDEIERLAAVREALANLVERLSNSLLGSQSTTLYRLTREGIAALRDARRPRSRDLADALRLVLLFYRSGQWGDTERVEWERLTIGLGYPEVSASTRGLCDHIRRVLGMTEAP